MKRLLLSLLAAIALPTAINAEIINLECTETYADWKERRDYKEEEKSKIYIDIDTKRQSSTIDDGKLMQENVPVTTIQLHNNIHSRDFNVDHKAEEYLNIMFPN